MGSGEHALDTVEGMLLSGFMEAVTDRSGPVAGWLGSGAKGVLELRIPCEARLDLAGMCTRMGVGLTPLGRYRAVVDFPDGSFSVPVLTAQLPTLCVAAGMARALISWDRALLLGETPTGLPDGVMTRDQWVGTGRDLSERDLLNVSRVLAQVAWQQLNDGAFGSDFVVASGHEDVLAVLLADGHDTAVALHDASTDMLMLSRSALQRRHLLLTSELLARP